MNRNEYQEYYVEFIRYYYANDFIETENLIPKFTKEHTISNIYFYNILR